MTDTGNMEFLETVDDHVEVELPCAMNNVCEGLTKLFKLERILETSR